MLQSTTAKPRLIIDLKTLVKNYLTLSSLTQAKVGAVVKADAYGLGLGPVVHTLWSNRCRTFFVAFTDEALRLRRELEDAEIFVFAPFIEDDSERLLAADLKPCLYSLESANRFAGAAKKMAKVAKAALHVETGINRLGLGRSDVDEFLNSDFTRSLEVDLLMSHLACADDPASEQNPRQLLDFEYFKTLMPGVRASLANSGGVFLGPDYHMDLVRPGIALYGHDPHFRDIQKPRVAPVATLESRVGQVRTLQAGESVGYGAIVTCDREKQIGVVMGGYADGIMRSLVDNDFDGSNNVLINGKPAPMFGRISMDLFTVDLSEFDAGTVQPGQRVEIFGSQLPLEALANLAGTIPYEILTQIGSRVPREYK